jgi:large subunit ribosomal protein L25
MPRKELSLQPRQVFGKKVKTLRQSGILPANIFGHGLDSLSVQVDTEALEQLVRAAAANEVIDLKVDGERSPRPAVIQRIQRNPLNSGYLHADFYQVSLREKMRADVPLVIVGTSDAVETYNGVVVHATEVLHVEALPLDIPGHIEVDISGLRELESTIHVRDLHVPSNVTVLTDGDVAVVKVASPRVGLEEEELPVAAAAQPEAAEEAAAEPEAETSAEPA